MEEIQVKGLLSLATKGVQHKPRRVMIYGTNGIGKSTFGAMAENPIFIRTEDGLDDIDTSALPVCETFDSVMEQIGALCAEQHDYKTVCIDSLDWLERLIFDRVAKDNNKKSIEDIGYAKGYTFALKYWNEFLKGLSFLRNDINMEIILIAHSKIEKYEPPEAEGYDRYSPNLHKLASALIREWCDEVLFAKEKVYVNKQEGAKRAKGISSGERVLMCVEKASHLAKNRLGMPDEIALDYSEYKSFVKGK